MKAGRRCNAGTWLEGGRACEKDVWRHHEDEDPGAYWYFVRREAPLGGGATAGWSRGASPPCWKPHEGQWSAAREGMHATICDTQRHRASLPSLPASLPPVLFVYFVPFPLSFHVNLSISEIDSVQAIILDSIN